MPARNVTVSGLTLRHSASTFLAQYEVPSGGDWAAHRGGMVVVEGAAGVVVEGCTFDAPGGNGLVLSNYLRDTRVRRMPPMPTPSHSCRPLVAAAPVVTPPHNVSAPCLFPGALPGLGQRVRALRRLGGGEPGHG